MSLSKVVGQDPGEMVQTSLRGTVRKGLEGRHTQAVDGADVDDARGRVLASLCFQTRCEELGNCEDAVQVQGKNTGPCGIWVFIEGSAPVGPTVVDEHVKMVLTLPEFFGEALAVFQLVEIGGDRMGGPRAFMVGDVSN